MADDRKKEEMLRRVTGAAPPPRASAAPPPVRSSLLPDEEEALKGIGWKPGDPIPGNMAEIFAEVAGNSSGDLPPFFEGTPEPPRASGELTPEQRKEIFLKMQHSLAEEAAQREYAKQQAELMHLPESVRKAHETVMQHQAQRVAGVEVVLDDEAAGDKTTKQENAPKPETGSDAAMTHCPHCNADLAMPAIPEPDNLEKLAYLHYFLGEMNYVKEYELFGKNMIVAFRTLAPGEEDVIHRQVYRERSLGIINESTDFWERVNRFRLFLQLKEIRTNQTVKTLPDGLSSEVNAAASVFWDFKPPDEESTILPQIETYMLKHVMKTESIMRVLWKTCSQFNRLVVKMEENVHNSDFWPATEAPS